MTAAIDRPRGGPPVRPRPGPSRTRTWVRSHWPLVVLVVAGAVLRVTVQVAYQPALIYIDSSRYLEMSRTYEPSGVIPLGFPILLLSWAVPVGNLVLVALVQHLLGLAMGIGSYVLLLRWQVRRWLAAVAAAPVLLDGYQLQIEQNVLSDTLFQALVLAGLGVLLWRRPPPPWALGSGGLLLGLAATVRFVGVVLAVVAMCAVVLVWRSTWRTRIGALALLSACFVIPLGCAASWSSYSGKGIGVQGSMHGTLLYARAASIADCGLLRAAGAPSHVLRVCPAEPVGRRKGPDYYAHDPRSPARTVPPPPSMSRQEVMGAFGLAVLRSQPGDIGYAIATDFAKGFALVRTTAPNDVPLERWRFPLSYPQYPPYHPGQITRVYGAARPYVDPGLARFLRDYQRYGYTPGPVLALGALAGLAGAAGVRLSRVRAVGRPGIRAACLLPSITGVGLLLLAAAFEFSWRYQLPGLVLFPLAGAFGITAILGWAPTGVRTRPAPVPASPEAATAAPATGETPVPECEAHSAILKP